MNKLSIIICKYNISNFDKCIKNIKQTIRGDYELVVIDNTSNTYTIFSAYNEGILRSSGDYLCFMHEDIIYFDDNWDENIYAHFQFDSQLGMIGIAGGSSYPIFPCSWTQTYYPKDYAISIMGSSKNEGENNIREGFKNDTKQVLIVDGLWFCIKKSLIQNNNIKFDDVTFSGFHRYDYDISFQIAQVAKIKVVQNIRMEHHSSGNRNNEWVEASLQFQNKWKHLLPCRIKENEVGVFKLKKTVLDLKSFYQFIFMMNNFQFSTKDIRTAISNNYFILPNYFSIQFKIILIYLLGFNLYNKIKSSLKKIRKV